MRLLLNSAAVSISYFLILILDRFRAQTILSFTCADENCSYCSVDTATSVITCLKCEYGFYLNSSNVCVQSNCATNQYFDENGVCQDCHESCTSCVSAGLNSCTFCRTTYYPVHSDVAQGLVECWRCADKNCRSCDRFGTCSSCASGYIPQGKTCVKCPIQYAVCKTLTIALSCFNGFHLSDDLTACKPTMEANACAFGEYKDTLLQCQDCMSGCLHCNAETQCFLCISGMFIDTNGLCTACSANCKTCTDALTCQACVDGFFVLNGACEAVSVSNIVTCNLGEHPDWNSNVCIRCPEGCQECDQVTGNCLRCSDEAVNRVNNGVCERICATTEFYNQSTISSIQLTAMFIERQPIILGAAAAGEALAGTCDVSAATNCLSPAYSSLHCQKCASGFYNALGLCVQTCPSGFFPAKEYGLIQGLCSPCPKGCSDCQSLEICTACTADFALTNYECFNDNVRSVNSGYENGYVFFDGFFVSSCPKTTILVGNRCVLMSTCKRASFRVDIKEITCDECQLASDVITGQLLPIPDLLIAWFGKCYTDCPAGSAGCKQPCQQPNLQAEYLNGQLSACSNTPTCGSPMLGRFCETSASPCALTNEYLDVFALANDYHSFTPGNEAAYCKTCPTGCASCVLSGREVLCTVCDAGYDEYQLFSMQNPSSYNVADLSIVYLMKHFCKPVSVGTPCQEMTGFEPHASILNTCIMCLTVGTATCSLCPPNSYLNKPTSTCVDYCNNGQIVYFAEHTCYDRPSFSVKEDFLTHLYTVGAQTYNVATTEMEIQINLQSAFNLEVLDGKCYINIVQAVEIPYPVSTPPIVTPSIIMNIPLPAGKFSAMLAAGSFSIYCQYYVQIDARPVQGITASKWNILQISQPNGVFRTTPTAGNSQTLFTTTIQNWSMDLIKSSFPTTIFKYEIALLARNNKNLNIPEAMFPLKQVSMDVTPELFPTNGSSLTSFVLKLGTNLQNKIFNSVKMLLIVTPTIPELAHLQKNVTIALDYSFTKDSTPKNSQRNLISRILETKIYDANGNLNKQAILDIANETLLSRGSLPFDQEDHENIQYQKQSSVLSRIGLTIPCDDFINCSEGDGTCKRLNFNWYSMCQCPTGYTGEQCAWTEDSLNTAKQLLSVYLQVIIDDIPNLEQAIPTNLSVQQMLTLLQVWTDTRDTFSADAFEQVAEVFSTDSLSATNEQSRLFSIFDNMIDILRTINSSTDKFKEHEARINTNIESTMRSLIGAVDTTASTSVIVDQSNFKGVLVHSDGFNTTENPLTTSIDLPNSMCISVPTTLVHPGEFLQILIKPLDILHTSVITTQTQLTFILSNSLTVSVKSLDSTGSGTTTGSGDIDVASILTENPMEFELSFVMPTEYTTGFTNLTCVYWDEANSVWSTEGVTFVRQNPSMTVTCRTTHLTQFALANINYDNSTTTNPNSNDLDIAISSDFRFVFILVLITLGVSFVGLYAMTILCIKALLIRSQSEKRRHLVKAGVIPHGIFLHGIFPAFFAVRGGSNSEQFDEENHLSQGDFNYSLSVFSSDPQIFDKHQAQHPQSHLFFHAKPQQVVPIQQKQQQRQHQQQQNQEFPHSQQMSSSVVSIRSNSSFQVNNNNNNSNQLPQNRQQNFNQTQHISISHVPLHSTQQSSKLIQTNNDSAANQTNFSSINNNQIALAQSSYMSSMIKDIEQQNISSIPLYSPLASPHENQPQSAFNSPKNRMYSPNEYTSHNYLIPAVVATEQANTGYLISNQSSAADAGGRAEKAATPGIEATPNDVETQQKFKLNKRERKKNFSQKFKSNKKGNRNPINNNNGREIPSAAAIAAAAANDLATANQLTAAQRVADIHESGKQSPSSTPQHSHIHPTPPPPTSSSPLKKQPLDSGLGSGSKDSSSVLQQILPYLTLFCWRYSYESIKNTDRVLFFIGTFSLLMCCSSYYFEYVNLEDSWDFSPKNLFAQSLIVFGIYEMVLWFVVAIVGLRRLLLKQICCCFWTPSWNMDSHVHSDYPAIVVHAYAPQIEGEIPPRPNSDLVQNGQGDILRADDGDNLTVAVPNSVSVPIVAPMMSMSALRTPSPLADRVDATTNNVNCLSNTIPQNNSKEREQEEEERKVASNKSISGERCCCCGLSSRKLYVLTQIFNFTIAFTLFISASYVILQIQANTSKRRFLIWAFATGASVLENFILEFLSLFFIVKFKMPCLFSFVKYKRLDF